MKQYHTIICPFCKHDDLVKNGHDKSGTQRWRCNHCKKCFQPAYKYKARKPGIKEAIIQQTLNISGVRDISRNLKINRNTAVAVLKKTLKTNPYFITEEESQILDTLEVNFRFGGETDEFWSFVRNKNNQRRTWYAIERKSGCILARHKGKRSNRDFLILWNLLSVFNIKEVLHRRFGFILKIYSISST
jgi:transposase